MIKSIMGNVRFGSDWGVWFLISSLANIRYPADSLHPHAARSIGTHFWRVNENAPIFIGFSFLMPKR